VIQDIAMRTDEHNRCAQPDAHRVTRTDAHGVIRGLMCDAVRTSGLVAWGRARPHLMCDGSVPLDVRHTLDLFRLDPAADPGG
jgi:hypothetical protein